MKCLNCVECPVYAISVLDIVFYNKGNIGNEYYKCTKKYTLIKYIDI